ncbi:unnamed protein product [Rotaria sp. Silwood2]|nr:unnamed protein product [Rotaria sp. Silwood2]
MIDVLYSLVDVNERFNRLILDPLYIHNLDLTVKSSFIHNSSTNNQILDRICEKILPQIHDQVNELACEPHSIERILIIDYPELYSLSLINFQKEIFSQYLTGNEILRYLLTNQITHLVVDIKNEIIAELSDENQLNIFPLILCLCKRLTDLTFCEFSSNQRLTISIFNLPSINCVSSTLMKLNIVVNTFDDCLYLLDGRLECLSTLVIKIQRISRSVLNIDNTRKLLKFKYFSLTSVVHTIYYNEQIVPLLNRMINLEELTLFITIFRHDSNYIDGTHLYDEILIYMPQLNKFTFSIITEIFINNINIDFPSNDNIQFSFIKKGFNQVGSYADFDSTKNLARCHVYSLPYEFKLFINLNNFFQGGMFNKVRSLVMNDTSPFEHELFKLVSQDFPFLENLYVRNCHPQKNKQHSSTLILFSHLVALNLNQSTVDYAEQFLFEKNTRLPRLLKLTIRYETLAIITNNFTNDAARLNCVNLQSIHTNKPFVRPEKFHQYFPLL